MMINEIENFGKDLYQRCGSSDVDKLPPLTYEEYNAAVVQHLIELRIGISDVEKRLMKQSTF